MSSSRRPRPRQVVQAVPMHAFGSPDEQLGGAAQTELLYFLGPESRYAHFGHPHRKIGHLLDLADLVGPFMDSPMIPVERETVYGDHIHVIEHALHFYIPNKDRIHGGDAAQNAQQEEL